MATFLERATHSVNRVCSLYCLFVILVISHLSFDGKTLVLIAPAPGHCSLLTFLLFIISRLKPWCTLLLLHLLLLLLSYTSLLQHFEDCARFDW